MAATTIAVLAEEERAVEGRFDADGRALVALDDLPGALGWALKPEGLCRGDVCVPVRDRAGLIVDGEVDLSGVAAALDRPVLVDPEAGVVAFGSHRAERRQGVASHEAPPFTLPDLEGNPRSLAEWHTKRKLLIAFASW